MIFRMLDIETVPDHRYWGHAVPQYKLAPSPESICLGELSTTAHVKLVEAFPPPQACRVVALSTVDVSFAPDRAPMYQLEGCASECRWSADEAESDVLERRLLVKFSASMAEPGIHLVTWNGRTFDLPVIMMRCLLHGVAAKWYYETKDVRYRYSAMGHCDLMDFLGDYGASRNMRLDDVAHLSGLPGKTDTSGDQVLDIYRASCRDLAASAAAQARVAGYCQQDTVQTAIVWLRSRVLVGKITVDTYHQVLEMFRASEVVRAALGRDFDWRRLVIPGGAT